MTPEEWKQTLDRVILRGFMVPADIFMGETTFCGLRYSTQDRPQNMLSTSLANDSPVVSQSRGLIKHYGAY